MTSKVNKSFDSFNSNKPHQQQSLSNTFTNINATPLRDLNNNKNNIPFTPSAYAPKIVTFCSKENPENNINSSAIKNVIYNNNGSPKPTKSIIKNNSNNPFGSSVKKISLQSPNNNNNNSFNSNNINNGNNNGRVLLPPKSSNTNTSGFIGKAELAEFELEYINSIDQNQSEEKTQEFCFNYSSLLQHEVEQHSINQRQQEEDQQQQPIFSQSKRAVVVSPMKIQSDSEYDPPTLSDIEFKKLKLKNLQSPSPIENVNNGGYNNKSIASKKMSVPEFEPIKDSNKTRFEQIQERAAQLKLEEKLEKLKQESENQLLIDQEKKKYPNTIKLSLQPTSSTTTTITTTQPHKLSLQSLQPLQFSQSTTIPSHQALIDKHVQQQQAEKQKQIEIKEKQKQKELERKKRVEERQRIEKLKLQEQQAQQQRELEKQQQVEQEEKQRILLYEQIEQQKQQQLQHEENQRSIIQQQQEQQNQLHNQQFALKQQQFQIKTQKRQMLKKQKQQQLEKQKQAQLYQQQQEQIILEQEANRQEQERQEILILQKQQEQEKQEYSRQLILIEQQKQQFYQQQQLQHQQHLQQLHAQQQLQEQQQLQLQAQQKEQQKQQISRVVVQKKLVTTASKSNVIIKKTNSPKSPFSGTNKKRKSLLNSIVKEIRGISVSNGGGIGKRQITLTNNVRPVIASSKLSSNNKSTTSTMDQWKSSRALTTQKPFQFECSKRNGEIPLGSRRIPVEKPTRPDPNSSEAINKLFNENNKRKNALLHASNGSGIGNSSAKFNYPKSPSEQIHYSLPPKSPYKDLTNSLIQCLQPTINNKTRQPQQSQPKQQLQPQSQPQPQPQPKKLTTISRITKTKEFNFQTTNRVRKSVVPNQTPSFLNKPTTSTSSTKRLLTTNNNIKQQPQQPKLKIYNPTTITTSGSSNKNYSNYI